VVIIYIKSKGKGSKKTKNKFGKSITKLIQRTQKAAPLIFNVRLQGG